METFEAELPNQCWQADVTHWQLENHSEVEILDVIDDHSPSGHRQPRSSGHHRPNVTDTFTAAFAHWGT